MKRTMVRYKVKADRAAENESYIAAVFDQLKREKPPGLRYASFKLDDQVSFVHIASIEVAGARNPLGQMSAFKSFVAQISDRCENPPVVADLNEIGSYRFFGD